MLGSVKRAHQAARLQAIRLCTCSNTHLDEQGITAPASIAQATGLSAAEAVRLLTRKQWREGDGEALKVVAVRLGLAMPLEGLDSSAGPGRAA
jgi:hypothetical protein